MHIFKMLVIDVGSYGKGDSYTFGKSKMGQHIYSGDYNFPEDEKLPGTIYKLNDYFFFFFYI